MVKCITKKALTSLLLTSSVILSSSSIIAAPAATVLTTPTANPAPVIIPTAPSLNAKGYVLMDANSGVIIASKNMHKRMPPASLTKLMTLYVTSQALKQGQISLDSKVRISKKAWRTGGSRMFLRVGSTATVRQLISGIIVASGNDACVALSQFVGGNETTFVDMMNQTAQQLGMKGTHFVDSTGLPNANHYTTPYDLALLTRAIIERFPEDYSWYKQKWITYNGIKQPNRNRLLWRDNSVDGLKTGHTNAAGYCLISSANRDGMRLISVVMGTPTDAARANDSQALLNWGFRFYQTHKLYKAKTALAMPRVYFAESKSTPLGLDKPLYVTIPTGTYAKLHPSVHIDKQLKAPIQAGQPYGSLTITLNKKVVAQAPLVALQNNPKGGFFSRTWDHILLLFS